MQMINKLKPSVWFASHHHISFRAKVEGTSFIAIPKPTLKGWYVVSDVENKSPILPFKYRGEWLSILKATSSEMEDPAILKNVNWDEKWEQLKPQMEKIDDQPVGPFVLNPYEYTARFCQENNIYCPNAEIREYMDKKK